MLILLSPAKSLDYDTPVAADWPHSLPPFLPETTELIELLRTKAPQDLAALMKISDALAALNVARYAAWSPEFPPHNARPAILAFNGDVYDGLNARTLAQSDLEWAQQHLRILSGLYGVLRPLDWMQAYRLEMGTRLATPVGNTLYQFWGTKIAAHLQQELAHDPTPVVLHLASQEYFKAVDTSVLRSRIVECVFEEWKGGSYKIVSFHAKRARGLMARHAILQRATQPEQLLGFQEEGYAFDPHASECNRLVFRRRLM
ncbi:MULTISPECIES: peroxide stress protein YaaA [Giesbergeria]|uniref:UPF0246 protein ACFO6X_02495 n=1 Tax=Giesbergeria sinuosa TaxID=80883 RepID=A0ABV9QDX7_9BURK